MISYRKKPLSPELSKKLIEALGDSSFVADCCQVSIPAVSQWKKNGIPNAQLRFLRERFKDHQMMKNPEIKFY